MPDVDTTSADKKIYSIVRLHREMPELAAYKSFLNALAAAGFRGEIDSRQATREVLATDNSIYRRLPQAVVFPKDSEDVELIARILDGPEHRGVAVAPRGGGTGTNGQSLTDGVVVDLSRHMNRIIEVDPAGRWARVQAGVVKDQLDAEVAQYGLFFAPELSTSNRATVGGMVATDASGQGSCTYGKTRNHVIELLYVLPGGERLSSKAVGRDELKILCAAPGRVGEVYRCAESIAREKAALIESTFPKLSRCLTGYDLAHLHEPDGRFNLNSILCGSEGSLGFLVEAKLNLMPIPRFTMLVNVRYANFMDALSDAQALMKLCPLSIETVDSNVLLLAKGDLVWETVSEYFPEDADRPTLGINLVELAGDDEAELTSRVSAFIEHLRVDLSVRRLGETVAVGEAAVSRVYQMRKRAVGLLGNVSGESRPQPFVEDTAVPPESLPAYIAEFRELLDSHGLRYGMFGHVDAGVLHVRPALDMKREDHAAKIRPITDAVVALTRKYGGLLWGEHGKGLRSEYSPTFFGDLYTSLQAIKTSFDPNNQFNPGKIATPLESSAGLLRIDEVLTRGESDRTIDERVWRAHGAAMHCNGNGACYNFDPDDAMCPSWKATRERSQSPKGRATLMREWLRRQGAAGVDVLAVGEANTGGKTALIRRWKNSRAASRGEDDFSHEVYEAMAGCLACKSCATQCPVKVNVPDFRAQFLALYHTRYVRPLKDYMVASLEGTIPSLARIAPAYNLLMGSRPVRALVAKYIGLVDSPPISRADLGPTLKKWNVKIALAEKLKNLSSAERGRSVILVQDAFTRYFDTTVFANFIELAARLGFVVYLAPFLPNGKPLHVHGFLSSFERTAKRTGNALKKLATFGVPLVGLDPAMTLVYRQEYRQVLSLDDLPEVLLPQEWLLKVWPKLDQGPERPSFRLLPHCTEKTNVPGSTGQWRDVYERAGLKLSDESTGCCGMSGTFGHETRNLVTSRRIFDLSWSRKLQGSSEALATGFSCRSQADRFANKTIRHPIEPLLDLLKAG